MRRERRSRRGPRAWPAGRGPGAFVSVLDQVTVTAPAAALTACLEFYDAALAALGWVRVAELVDEEEEAPAVEAVAWGPPDGAGVLWLITGAAATSGMHLRIQTGSRAEVETFSAAAVLAGGVQRAAPRRWPIYRRGEFNAIVADPLGNLVEAVAPE